MRLRVLIVPDKFKGTLTASEAAKAIARGWHKARPEDRLTLLPLSDGGDGFGEIMAALCGARPRKVRTVDAAHRPLTATWWWEPRSRTAIIESARVIGLAVLPRGKLHPFKLDTAGLGAVLKAAAEKRPKRCLIGIGGSATNDGGFGLARALGWHFLDRAGAEIMTWTDLARLRTIEVGRGSPCAPKLLVGQRRARNVAPYRFVVAVDVQNRLLGARGCTQVFGPQKGLRPAEFPKAEKALRRLAVRMRRLLGRDNDNVPGAGAAGGLGFGLMSFADAKAESGFALFAKYARLETQLRRADLVVTAEGCLDRSTLMGKGVGELAALCRRLGKPCLGIGGQTRDQERLRRHFTRTLALVDFTTPKQALLRPARWLETAAAAAARTLSGDNKSGLPSARQRE